MDSSCQPVGDGVQKASREILEGYLYKTEGGFPCYKAVKSPHKPLCCLQGELFFLSEECDPNLIITDGTAIHPVKVEAMDSIEGCQAWFVVCTAANQRTTESGKAIASSFVVVSVHRHQPATY